jgi:vacuolar iron transporter family protein
LLNLNAFPSLRPELVVSLLKQSGRSAYGGTLLMLFKFQTQTQCSLFLYFRLSSKNMSLSKRSTKLLKHNADSKLSATVREVVFGLEDGMVSTLGVITGIAIGTANHFVVILSGFVVIAVEALSMAAGSYLSSKSVREVEDHKLKQESKELKKFPKAEVAELKEMYVIEGVSEKDAEKIANEISKHPKLMLKEMACHQLKIIPDKKEEPVRNAFLMGISYIVGGIIPVAPYFFRSVYSALPISIIITLIALFIVGAGRTKFTAQKWWKSGFELMMISAGAALVGYLVAKIVESAFGVVA